MWYLIVGHLEDREDGTYVVLAESPRHALKDAARECRKNEGAAPQIPFYLVSIVEYSGEARPRVVSWEELR